LAARLPHDFTILDYFHGRINQPKPAIIQRLAAKRQAKNPYASKRHASNRSASKGYDSI
jgi:hypothetical protein